MSWLRWGATCALVLLATLAEARTIRIELDGSGDYPTIQDGIDNAAAGDVVLVGPGTYTWTNQNTSARTYEDGLPADLYGMCVFWTDLRDEVTLRSVAGPELTILDAEHKGRIFFANGDNSEDIVEIAIEGFSAINGRAPDTNRNREEEEGGAAAFHLVHPIVRNCIFRNCTAEFGGALWLGNTGFVVIEDCVFTDNTAQRAGGAILNVASAKETTYLRCTFERNRSGVYGGAIAVYNDTVVIRDSVFRDNDALQDGAALWFMYTKPATVENCWIEGGESRDSVVEVRSDPFPPDAPPGLGRTRVQFHGNVVLGAQSRGIRLDADSRFFASCNNIYGNKLGNWTTRALSYLNQDGNISSNPWLCGDPDQPFGVASDSPLLAVNNPSCDADMAGAVSACEPFPKIPPTAAWRAAAPNPFRAKDGGTILEYALPSSGPAVVSVFSVRGELVRELEGTSTTAIWDGRDASGHSVAAGVYVIRAEAEGHQIAGRVVLLK